MWVAADQLAEFEFFDDSGQTWNALVEFVVLEEDLSADLSAHTYCTFNLVIWIKYLFCLYRCKSF